MNRGLIATAVVIVIALILAAKFVFLDRNRELVSPQRVESVPVPEKQQEAPVETGPRYPVSEIRVDAMYRSMPEPEEEPLPELAQSDEPLREMVAGMDAGERLDDLFIFDSVIRHFVVTVDNMTREKLPQKYRIAERVPGSFMVEETGDPDRYFLDPENYQRYTPFIEVAEVIDLSALLAIYSRYYPLFQEAYEELGYPDRYFNDRLIEVIDHLLAAPRVEGRIELVRPKVFYRFADADMESLSAGQKAMIRMGPDNAERIKTRLRELRALLVRD
ncbi:MAG: DUF3014 domain-containing protein [Gammaproteobacteria bacterium]